MMKLLSLLIGLAHAQTVATPPSYIIFPSQQACLARSKQMCQAMGCDGVHTIYWWDCSTALNAGTVGLTAVTAGSYAMRIDNGTHYGSTASNAVSVGTQGLSTQEQMQVVTQSSLKPVMATPTPLSGAATAIP